MKPCIRDGLLVSLGVIGCCDCALASGQMVDVADELSRLQEVHDFDLRGIEQTTGIEGRAEGEELVPRLRQLLDGFDHVIVQGEAGRVERIIILGERVAVLPPAPAGPPLTPPSERALADEGESGLTDAQETEEGSIMLPTQRQGRSHTVNVVLEGAQGQQVQQVMLIDTGADRVVLPRSLIAALGIPSANLSNQPVQTANGTVDAAIGQLAAVWLGEQRVAEVGVAFIDDARLGGQSLLGMSVLSRYRVTIDDALNQVILKAR